MAGKKKAPLWRQAFLRALRRSGNVRASAFEAGVDPGTAYDHRTRDAGFRAKWVQAKKAHDQMAAKKRAAGPLHRRTGGPAPHAGEEFVIRRTKHGDKLVRASPGGWSQRIEESFLDALEETGCVRTAARTAGISTNAFYERRKHYPEFRARWAERVGRFREQLPGLLNAAAVESMRPQPADAKRRGRARLPKLSPGEAIRLYAINERAKGERRGEMPQRDEVKAREALVQTLARLFDMLERRQDKARRAAGWQEAGGGIWVPPGWTPPPPSAAAGKPGEAGGDPAQK